MLVMERYYVYICNMQMRYVYTWYDLSFNSEMKISPVWGKNINI